MDRELIYQKLESLRRCIIRLETRCPGSADELVEDIDAQDIVSLNLTRAVQLSVDLALHWLACQPELKAPSTMGEAFVVMADAGLIPAELAGNLRKAVGFRNLAVHSYDDINWNVVFAICQHRLDDFKLFAKYLLTAADKL